MSAGSAPGLSPPRSGPRRSGHPRAAGHPPAPPDHSPCPAVHQAPGQDNSLTGLLAPRRHACPHHHRYPDAPSQGRPGTKPALAMAAFATERHPDPGRRRACPVRRLYALRPAIAGRCRRRIAFACGRSLVPGSDPVRSIVAGMQRAWGSVRSRVGEPGDAVACIVPDGSGGLAPA